MKNDIGGKEESKILFLGQDLTLKANGRFINSLINVTGYTSIALSIIGIGLAVLFYVYGSGKEFSFFTVFMSTVGGEPLWPMKFFNGAILLTATLRLIFFFLVVHKCFVLGTDHKIIKVILVFAILAAVGRMGSAIVSYNTIKLLHRILALLYFLSLVGTVAFISLAEWRLDMRKILPITGSILVLIATVLTVLFFLAFRTDLIARTTPAIWEWSTYALLLIWTFLHTFYLTRDETPRRRKKTSRMFSKHGGGEGKSHGY